MTSEHQTGPGQEPQEAAAAIGAEVLPAGRQPAVPKGISGQEAESLKDTARELAAQLESAGGAKELEVTDNISNLGLQAQRGAAAELSLLRARVGEMMTRDGPAKAVSNDLAELRLALNQINPQEADPKGTFGRLMQGRFLGRSVSSVRIALERIAIRYEPVVQQVAVIEARLREGRAMLARDNIELRKLYESVESQQVSVQRNAYLGELLILELEELYERTEDQLRRERIRYALHDVSLRVQDLRTMEEVSVQFFVSIDLIRQNNTRLGQAVERTLALSTNVVMVGLAVQMALLRQQRVLEANQRTREFLGNLIVTNAAVIKRHTTEIGDAYNNPVVAVEKLTQAHNDLIDALDDAERIKQEGIARARENIAKLSEMHSDLERRTLANHLE